MSLQDIYLRYQQQDFGGDKGTQHSYIDVYAEQIVPKFGLSLLEIGVYEGHSLMMWNEYLPDCRVVGVDVDISRVLWPKLLNQIVLGNACSRDVLNKITGNFDYVIDDGSHNVDDQKSSFMLLWDRLLPNAKYFIEDIVSIEVAEDLAAFVWAFTGFQPIIYDLRHVKGRYDDILLMVCKSIG